MNAVFRNSIQASNTNRLSRALARVRQRQLELALAGKVAESERFARRAMRLRTQAQRANPEPALAPC